MIHVSDISWTRKINHPSEVFKKGDEVEAVVLEVDKANQRISVGVKQLTVDPWSNIDQFYKVGDLVTGNVTKLASFGAFVGLQHDIDGLVHISQVSEERTEKIKNVLKVGQEVTARVIKIDKTDRRIGLSIKAAAYSTEQLKAEQAILESLKPGEDLVALAARLRRRRRNAPSSSNGARRRWNLAGWRMARGETGDPGCAFRRHPHPNSPFSLLPRPCACLTRENAAPIPRPARCWRRWG